MKHAKRILAMFCIFVLLFTVGFRYIGIDGSEAHATGALSGQALGALTAAGLVSLNIVAQVVAGNIGAYFGWQAKPSAESILNYNFPNATSVISDYMNASTIKVSKGVTTIDGVVYDEVFIEPGTFTNGLKTNLFDFKTKWSILSGQSGINLATGWGYADGLPLYNVNGTIRSQDMSLTAPGVYNVTNNIFAHMTTPYSPNAFAADAGLGTAPTGPFTIFWNGDVVKPIRLQVRPENGRIRVWWYYENYPSWGWQQAGAYSFDINQQPFQYDYVSGIVPATSSDIPDDYGLSINIPHDQLTTFYNTYPQYNVDNSTINIQQDQIDIDELINSIFDKIESMEDIKASWTDGEAEPEPEPPGPAEDILDGVNTIITQQNQQISQNQQQQVIQQQQLQEQQQISQDTSSIKDVIDSVTQTPGSEDLPDFKFDLRELFPFCIPFDIYRLLSSFDAEPIAPHVQLPIVIQSIGFSYNLDLDFSEWDPVAQAMRTAELIVYAIALAWATGKVIKW